VYEDTSEEIHSKSTIFDFKSLVSHILVALTFYFLPFTFFGFGYVC